MEDSDLQRRAELARRLKAARWLAGGIRPSTKARGPEWEIYPLDAKDLVARPGMEDNQITASKIGSIERMERHTPPMEIAVIARGLGVSPDWLAGAGEAPPITPAETRAVLVRLLEDFDLASGQAPPRTMKPRDAGDHPEPGEGVAGT